MATLKPFCGLRYRAAAVGDLADVVAPPYDVIDREAQAALYRRSPHNAVRLILNREADPYACSMYRPGTVLMKSVGEPSHA